MSGLGLTDVEIAVLIGLVLVGVLLLALLGRQVQPARAAVDGPPPAEMASLAAEVQKLKGRVGDVEHGINQVRTMMNALPTKDALYDIGLEVAAMQGELKLNSATTTATAASVKRIEDFIMRLAEKEMMK